MLLTAALLQVQLLGRFALTDVSGKLIGLRSRRARGLFAYLLLQQRRTETRSKLCSLLWADRGEAQARASLRQCLSDLRAALPPTSRDCLICEREIVRLDSSVIATDLATLKASIADGRPDALCGFLQQAGRLRLLEDIELPGPFSEWLDLTNAQFERDLQHAVYGFLRLGEERQEWRSNLELAEAYLQRDPVDETVTAALIRAERALGNSTSARRSYESLRTALRNSFGVAPAADTLAALDFAPSIVDPQRSKPRRELPTAATSLKAKRPLVIVAKVDSAPMEADRRLLGDIVKQEIVAGLSGFKDICVTSWPISLAECGGDYRPENGAGYIVGGSMWGGPNGIRFTAQLLRTSDQQVIWSERVEVSHDQITQVVDHLITKIIGAVSRLIDADLELQTPAWLDDQYARYVAARRIAAAPQSFEQARQAAGDLEKLIEENPDFILPYVPLARLYNTDFAFTRPLSSGPQEQAKAFALATSALSRDRGHIYAYTVVAWCHLRRGQWQAARTHFDQGLALNSFHADRVMDIGYGYLFLGEPETARRLLRRSLALNPTPKDDYFIDLAFIDLVSEDYAGALHYLDLVAEPTTWCFLYKALTTSLLGNANPELGQAFLQRAKALWDPNRPFTPEAVLNWVDNHHPLSSPGLRRKFLHDVRQVLF